MGMVVHDDFWAAAQAMPERQRAPFIYAIVEYRFTGREPEGSPAWLPTFLVLKGRLDMGDEKSERARKAANARWGNRAGGSEAADDADAHADAHAGADADAHADVHADASGSGNAEVEDEVECKDNPSIPFSEIVGALNDAAGTRYRPGSDKTRRLIRARWAEGFRLPDFQAVVRTMAGEWGGDPKMSRYLRPETLFGTKFESYLNRAPAGTGAVGYAEYD